MECCALSDGKEVESRMESWKMSVSYPTIPWHNAAREWNINTCVGSVQLHHQHLHRLQPNPPHTQRCSPASPNIKLHHKDFPDSFVQTRDVKHNPNLTQLYVPQSFNCLTRLLTPFRSHHQHVLLRPNRLQLRRLQVGQLQAAMPPRVPLRRDLRHEAGHELLPRQLD